MAAGNEWPAPALLACGSRQSTSAAPRDIGPTVTRLPRSSRTSASTRAWRTAAAAFGVSAPAVGCGECASGWVLRRRIAARKRFMVSMFGRGRSEFKRSSGSLGC